jgi:hypothetical protein
VSRRALLEIALREWLRDHHGVISYAEAQRLGATPNLIESKLRSGEWISIHRGVYRESACPPSPYQDLRAAYLATNKYGVISHLSAAWVWDLVDRAPEVPHVTVVRSGRDARSDKRITVHQTRDLDVTKAIHRNGIPVTNPMRTMVDVATIVLPDQLTEMVDKALAAQLVPTAGIQGEIDRLSKRGRGGVGILRRNLLERGYIGAPEPSVLEARARRLVAKTGLPLPEVEVRTGEDGKYRIDIAWAPILFAVEVDGYAWHFSPTQKQHDDARRNDLQRDGWKILVYSWTDVLREPSRVAREITEAYSQLSTTR